MGTPLALMLEEKSTLILDGAMGTELQRRHVDTGLPLWSANALMVHPDIVLQIHKDYITAGADIITTNTFRTTRRTLQRANLPDRSKQLTAIALDLATQARKAFPGRDVLIAGSMAPLEDCYRPDLVPPERELREEHAELATRLADADVDFLLVETMNTIREAYAACEAAKATGKEVVVSFICNNDGNLYGGENLQEAISAVASLEPTAFAVNCASPRYLQPALVNLKEATRLPFAVYGNVGVPGKESEVWEFTHDLTEQQYAEHALGWKRMGALIIGGCCGTTPEYIRAVREILPLRHEDTNDSV